MSRPLTDGERRYVRRILVAERRLITAVIPLLGLAAGLGAAMTVHAIAESNVGLAAIMLLVAVVSAAALIYAWRRRTSVRLDGEVKTIVGELWSSEQSVGDTSVTTDHIGTWVVLLPDHWRPLLRSVTEHVEAEVYDIPLRGADAMVAGTGDRGIVLSLGKLALEREMSFGLLSLPSPALPRWVHVFAFAVPFAGLAFALMIGYTDVFRSFRYIRSGMRQFQTVRAAAREALPDGTCVRIEKASIVTGEGPDGPQFYAVDLDGTESDHLRRLADEERQRLRIIDGWKAPSESSGQLRGLEAWVAELKSKPAGDYERSELARLIPLLEKTKAAVAERARDRRPAVAIAELMREVLRNHSGETLALRPAVEPQTPEESLPPPPTFTSTDALSDHRYTPVTESFLDELGQVRPLLGFYDRARGQSGLGTLSLEAISDGLRSAWLIAPGLVLAAAGLGFQIRQSRRDREIRLRIARSYQAA